MILAMLLSATGHSGGPPAVQHMPLASDVALAAMAAAGVWLLRRRLRSRPKD